MQGWAPSLFTRCMASYPQQPASFEDFVFLCDVTLAVA